MPSPAQLCACVAVLFLGSALAQLPSSAVGAWTGTLSFRLQTPAGSPPTGCCAQTYTEPVSVSITSTSVVFVSPGANPSPGCGASPSGSITLDNVIDEVSGTNCYSGDVQLTVDGVGVVPAPQPRAYFTFNPTTGAFVLDLFRAGASCPSGPVGCLVTNGTLTSQTITGALTPIRATSGENTALAGGIATCEFRGTTFGTGSTGTVTFKSSGVGENLTVSIKMSGLPRTSNATVAIHIHQYGDLSSDDGTAAGGHFSPDPLSIHGCPPNATRHVGDMGDWNTTFSSNGQLVTVDQTKSLDLMSLGDDMNGIVGRSVIVHAMPDSCTGSTGMAGNRIAQCVVGLSQKTNIGAMVEASPDAMAYAHLYGTSECPTCEALAWLEVRGDDLEMTIRVLSYGRFTDTGNVTLAHGVAVHQFGDLTDPDGSSVGSRFVGQTPPGSAIPSHALPPSTTRYAGDWGNIAGEWFAFVDTAPRATLQEYLGRAIAIHANQDFGTGEYCGDDGGSGPIIMVGVFGHPAPTNVVQRPPTLVSNSWPNLDCPEPDRDRRDANPGVVVALLVTGIAAAVLLFAVVVGGVLLSQFLTNKKE